MDLHNCKISISERTIRAFVYYKKSLLIATAIEKKEVGGAFPGQAGWINKKNLLSL